MTSALQRQALLSRLPEQPTLTHRNREASRTKQQRSGGAREDLGSNLPAPPASRPSPPPPSVFSSVNPGFI